MIELPKLKVAGFFRVEIIRNDGSKEYHEFANGITNEGKDNMLGAYFDAVAQSTTWYMGLINTTGSLLAADTLASHAWGEITDYDSGGSTRKVWNPNAPSGQAISNATPVTFTMTADHTVRGILICNASLGTSGKLWSTGAFSSNQVLVNGNVLNVVYGVSLT